MELSIADLKQLIGTTNQQKSHSFVVGEKYLIRTVTLYYTGQLVSVTDSDLVLKNAAWIANTGRFADCLRTGEFSEVKPYPDDKAVIINRGAIVDAVQWDHALPRNQK